MAFSGDVSVMPLDEVISFLATNGLGGVLTVCTSASSLSLYFRDGTMVFPSAPPPRKSGRIDRASLAAILDRGSKLSRSSSDRLPAVSGKRKPKPKPKPKPKKPAKQGSGSRRALQPDVIEKILARAQQLDAKELAQQIEEAIHQGLRWAPARFEFTPGKLPFHVKKHVDAGRFVGFDANSILMEAARRRDDTKRLRKLPPEPKKPRPQGNARDLHGTLDGIGLAAVLQSLNTQGRTGTLSVFTSDHEENLYFNKGEAFVLIKENDDEGGEFARELLGESWFDNVDLAKNLARTHAGQVSESDLTEAELRAVKDRFLDVLFWDDAEFVFSRGKLPYEFGNPGENVSRIALQTKRFLLEAIQRLTEWDGVRRVIGGRNAVLDFVNFERKMDQSASMTGRSLQVMTLIDGRLTFDELVRLSGLEHLEVGRIVKDLIDQGHLRVVEEVSSA